MQIFVNDQELEASLVDENNLYEVYESVNEWTIKSKKYILGFLVDHTEYSIHQLNNLKQGDINRMDFFIGDEVEMMISTIEELDRYIEQIGSALYEEEAKNPEDFMNLIEGIHWFNEIMKSISNILKIDISITCSPVAEKGDISISDILKSLEECAASLANQFSIEAKESFLAYLRGLKYFVMKLGFQVRMMNASFDELMESVDEFEHKIDELIKELISINIAFSTGNDGQALNILDIATEKLNHYLSVLYALDFKYNSDTGISIFQTNSSGEILLKHSREITEHLRNLSDALEKKDIVTVGDILEYELSESLKNLQPHLSGIKDFLLARK